MPTEPESMSSDDRWKFSLHEAGHACAAIALGGRCTAVVLHRGGGGALIGELPRDNHVYATAAGPVAEWLSMENPCPTESPVPDRPLTIDDILTRGGDLRVIMACDAARPAGDRQILPNDDAVIFAWAVDGMDSTLDSGIRRLDHARRMGAKVVVRVATAIVRVATGLYIAGELDEQEILDLYTGAGAEPGQLASLVTCPA